MRWVCALLIACALSPLAMPQENASSSQQQRDTETTAIEGIVVSSSRETLVVRTDDNQHQLFVFDRNTTKPRTISPGARVRIVSTPGEDTGTRLASNVMVVTAAPGAPAKTATAQAA